MVEERGENTNPYSLGMVNVRAIVENRRDG